MKIFTIWYKYESKARIYVTNFKGWTQKDAVMRLEKSVSLRTTEKIEIVHIFCAEDGS